MTETPALSRIIFSHMNSYCTIRWGRCNRRWETTGVKAKHPSLPDNSGLFDLFFERRRDIFSIEILVIEGIVNLKSPTFILFHKDQLGITGYHHSFKILVPGNIWIMLGTIVIYVLNYMFTISTKLFFDKKSMCLITNSLQNYIK